MIQDVLSGAIDAGFLPSGFLEQNLPAAIPSLLLLNLVAASSEGAPYPYLTSTPVLPSFGFSAGPAVPRLLRQQVASALMRLNHTQAALAGTGISTFTAPSSYDGVRRTQLARGIMFEEVRRRPPPPPPAESDSGPVAVGRDEGRDGGWGWRGPRCP